MEDFRRLKETKVKFTKIIIKVKKNLNCIFFIRSNEKHGKKPN